MVLKQEPHASVSADTSEISLRNLVVSSALPNFTQLGTSRKLTFMSFLSACTAGSYKVSCSTWQV
jgi:hypothetical protein